MRTLVRRTESMPHDGILFVDRPAGKPSVVWLHATVFSALDADRLEAELNKPGPPMAVGTIRS